MVNVTFGEAVFIVCALLNSGKGKTTNTFYQWEYK